MKIYNVLIFISLLSVSYRANAQAVTDSLNSARPVYANAADNFYKAIGQQSRLYNGIEYAFYDHHIEGNAYFMDNPDWNTGSVLYDGVLYKNIPVLYDIYKDIVITQLYHSVTSIMLVKNKVQSFDVLNQHFIHITENSPGSIVKEGFYDELYGGKIKVLSYSSKKLQTTPGVNGPIRSIFISSTDYYLYKDGIYHPVNSKQSFLNVLKDHKQEIQEYIRSNGIDYRHQKEEAMAKIAAYYDNLSK